MFAFENQNPILKELLNRYEVLFEGMPEPVFYGSYYPMGNKDGSHRNELWSMFDYARGLKRDKDTSGELYAQYVNTYRSDLVDLLSCILTNGPGRCCGIACIPSSDPKTVNRTTELVQSMLADQPGLFGDLTRSIIRTSKKQAAHAGGGDLLPTI